MAEPNLSPDREIVEALYDLTSDKDLMTIEKMLNRPDLFKILVDETVSVPMRHIRVERPKVRN